MTSWTRMGAALAAGFIGLTSAAERSEAQVRATLIAQELQSLPGTSQVVSRFYNPVTNGLGQVSVLGTLGNGDRFIFVKTDVVFESSSVTSVTLLSGDNNSSGVSDTGGWAYIPAVDSSSDRAIWTNNGVFIQDGDPAPNYPGGGTIFSLHRVSMLPDGSIYFLADITPSGGGSKRALYRNTTGTAADSTIVITNGDNVGIPVDDSTTDVDFDYQISDNGSHYIIVVDVATGNSSTDTTVVVNGAIVAQEDQPSGTGDNWDNFTHVSINNSGNYIFVGDTMGSSTTDNFLAYNGAVIVRQGDTVAGALLNGSAEATSSSINNDNRIVHQWSHGSPFTETLFATCDPTNVAASTQILLARGTMVDLDGNGTGDAEVTDLKGSTFNGNGLHLAEDGSVYIVVDLDHGSGARESLIRLDLICCGNGVVESGEDCDDGGESATCNADCTTHSCGDNKVNMSAGEECDEGGTESATCDDDCTLPVCGDGNTNAAANESCDDSGESATCNADCTTHACGDSVVNATAGEDCDPGAETIICDSDCTYASCGDGVLNTTAGETCDTAGNSASCDSDCTAPMCGDLLLNTMANEQCEDGNSSDGDGCSSTCMLEGGGGFDAGPGMVDAMPSTPDAMPAGPDAGATPDAHDHGHDDDDGCCAAAGNSPAEHAGTLLLAIFCGVLVARRRRSAEEV